MLGRQACVGGGMNTARFCLAEAMENGCFAGLFCLGSRPAPHNDISGFPFRINTRDRMPLDRLYPRPISPFSRSTDW